MGDKDLMLGFITLLCLMNH